MKKYILVAIVSIFVCNAAQAKTVIEAISTDSEIAASSLDLNTAKELSGKRIDGIVLGLKADSVQIIGDIQPAEKKELILSKPEKLALKGNVPNPAKLESKKSAIGEIAKESPIVTLGTMATIGAIICAAMGLALGGPVAAVVGGIIGAGIGVAVGIAFLEQNTDHPSFE